MECQSCQSRKMMKAPPRGQECSQMCRRFIIRVSEVRLVNGHKPSRAGIAHSGQGLARSMLAQIDRWRATATTSCNTFSVDDRPHPISSIRVAAARHFFGGLCQTRSRMQPASSTIVWLPRLQYFLHRSTLLIEMVRISATVICFASFGRVFRLHRRQF